ncbi:hypothetical protein LX36DRAFT_676421 [Colletotrichum falcatum]|nr:hypothetical protein LX36DRAFT_676421 [Colletotrichum falcatum]
MLIFSVLLLGLPASLCFSKGVVERKHNREYIASKTAIDATDNNVRHPFAQDIDIDTASGNEALWQRDSTEAWPKNHCQGCYRKLHGQKTDMKDLTTAKLVKAILVSEDKLKDKCVFYTGVPDTERATQGKKLGLSPSETLAARAARYACSKNMYSIWHRAAAREYDRRAYYLLQSLFPGGTGNVGPNQKPDNLEQYNYWEIDRPGSWLYPLHGDAYRFTYFENMSRAMARQCSGKVWVYSLNPKNLAWYGTQKGNNNDHSIWNTVEHKELIRRSKTTMIIGIDAVTNEMFELDVATLAYKKDYTHLLENESACSNRNLGFQLPGQDWFGTGRLSHSQ